MPNPSRPSRSHFDRRLKAALLSLVIRSYQTNFPRVLRHGRLLLGFGLIEQQFQGTQAIHEPHGIGVAA